MHAASESHLKPPNNDIQRGKKRTIWMSLLAAIFIIVGIAWLLYWLLIGRFYVYTEDAYVYGNQVMLTPQVTAGVKAIYADETDLVEKGQLVVELDRSDHEIKFEALKKELADTVREIARLFQDVAAKEASVTLKEAQLRQTELDYRHREPLAKTGAVSKEEFETYRTNVEVAEASLTFTRKELEMAKTLVEGTTIDTHPRVQKAVWDLRQGYLNLVRCQIWAPVTGFIAKRSVQVGDQAKEGDTLLYIVPLDYMWINANYKETQLRNVRIGQPVTFTADIYGGAVKFHGSIVGFQPGSGNAFALLPPENASGNWIKIIQRVPIRVSIDPQEIRDHPLFLGLSMRVTTDVHDTSGVKLSTEPTLFPILTTTIYSQQIEEVALIDPLIHAIIENNKFPKSESSLDVTAPPL